MGVDLAAALFWGVSGLVPTGEALLGIIGG